MSQQVSNEERFRALVTATSDVVYQLSADWNIMYSLDGRGFLKSTTEPITGWREKNVHPLDMEMVNVTIANAIKNKSIFELEHRVIRADGSTGWTISRAVPILNNEGDIIEWFGAASDITIRKEAEEKLQLAKENAERQQQVYEAVATNTPDLIYIFELDYTFSYANKALLEMWGKTWDQAIGKNLLENGYEPWHAAMHEREIDSIVATGKQVRGEVGFPHAILGKRIYDYILTPVFDVDGNVIAVSGVTRDVTERKEQELINLRLSDDLAALNDEAEAVNEELNAANEELIKSYNKLSQSEHRFKFLIQEAPVAIGVLHGSSLIIETANEKILEIWGKTKQIIGLPLAEALPELKGQNFLSILDEVFVSAKPYYANEMTALLVHEGQLKEFVFNFVYQPILDMDGKTADILIVAVDVTEQVNARRAVEQSEQHFKRLADLVPAKISNALPNGEVTFFNQHWLDFAGMSFEDMRDFGYQQMMHPDEIESFMSGLVTAAESGEPYVAEMRFKNLAGNYIWHLNVASPILNDEGKITMWVGSTTDIHAIKLEEQRKNDFVSMLSHELKTPITSIKGHVQLALRLLSREENSPLSTKLSSSLQRIDVLLLQLTGLIGDMLDLSRIDAGRMELKKEQFSIDGLVTEVVEDFRLSHQKHFFHLNANAVVDIVADRDRISQVLINLISNAIKYSPANNMVDVTVKAEDNQVLISIKDYGIGINSEDQNKIFDRFFRVEGHNEQYYSGFGIGLFLVQNIVTRHGGKVIVESEQNKGSVFTVQLPLQYL